MKKPLLLYPTTCEWEPEALVELRKHFNVIETRDAAVPLVTDKIEVLIVPQSSGFERADLAAFPSLRILASATTNSQHILKDGREANDPAIVTIAGDDCLKEVTSTAEHALGMMWAGHRLIESQFFLIEQGNWNRNLVPRHPKEMSEMTLGIVGMGRLGRMVEERAKPMFKEIVSVDVVGSLHDLFSVSDVVTFHIPSNAGQILTADLLEAMPENGIIVNTSYGELVAADTLLRDFLRNKLWAYVSDTLPGEFTGWNEESKKHLALHKDFAQYILTPHIGGSLKSARLKTQLALVDKLAQETANEQ